jgi:hypothetical protein
LYIPYVEHALVQHLRERPTLALQGQQVIRACVMNDLLLAGGKVISQLS